MRILKSMFTGIGLTVGLFASGAALAYLAFELAGACPLMLPAIACVLTGMSRVVGAFVE
jgi:hypothetical protein